MRVLFVDDQIPFLNDEVNKIYKDELHRELTGKFADFDSAYQEDYRWYTDLVRYLSNDLGFELRTTNSFFEAEELAQNHDLYDVAVIDLSWTGDPTVHRDIKKNAGLKIIRLISEKSKEHGIDKPAIAFLQNLHDESDTFGNVIEAGALPIPKYYTEVGHRSLGAAIKLLGKRSNIEQPTPYRYDIFLSYSSGDASAKEIKDGFEAVGLRCFAAKWEIDLSKLWSDEIRGAVYNSKIVVLLLTSVSVKSRWVIAEASAFWLLSKPILPALSQANLKRQLSFISAHQGIHIETVEGRKKLYQEALNICRDISRKKLLFA